MTLPAIGVAALLLSLMAANEVFDLLEGRHGRDELRIFDVDRSESDGEVMRVKRHFHQVWRAPDFEVRVDTNGSGFREDREFALEDVDISFFGDSFVFGHGVEQDARISDVVARSFPGELVVSLAYENGFAPAHYEVYAERHPELRPRIAVALVYLGNDLDVDERETRIVADPTTGLRRVELPFRSFTRQGHMMLHPSALRPGVRILRDCCALGRFLVSSITHSDRRDLVFDPRLGGVVPNSPNARALDYGTLIPSALSALEHLSGLRDLIEARGGRLVVLLIPQNFFVTRNARPHGRLSVGEASHLRRKRPLQRAILKWCVDQRLECLDPTPRLAAHPRHEELYFQNDAHWTALGHAVAAEFLLESLSSREDGAAARESGADRRDFPGRSSGRGGEATAP